LQHSHDVWVIVVGGQDQHAYLPVMGAYPAGDFDAGRFGHLNIYYGHIWLVLGNEAAGHIPIICLGNDGDVAGLFQKLADAGPNDGVVIGQ
jgi:hypothetical protein